MDLRKAVRELRAQLGDSQQAFATRLGMSTSEIANYEGHLNPNGTALASLAKVAEETGNKHLADAFMSTLGRELVLGSVSLFSCDDGEQTREPKAYLVLNVDGKEPIAFLSSFYETMIRYLYYGKASPEIKARAEKLLRDFEKSACDEWSAAASSATTRSA